MNIAFAICSALFFCTVGSFLLWHGSPVIQLMLMWAFVLAGLGQYVAQGNGLLPYWIAQILTSVAMLLMLAAFVIYSYSLK